MAKKTVAVTEEETVQVNTIASKMASLIEKANKKFSNNDRVRVSFGTELPKMNYVRTGNILVDSIILGGKGVPQGTITQLIGWEGAGKSRYLKEWIRSVLAQFPDKYVAVIPTERADYTPDTLIECGIDPERLIIIDGACAEDSFDILTSLLVDEKGDCLNVISMWAVDSVPGLRPKSSIKESYSDSKRMAATAALLHDVLRDLSYAQGDGIGVVVNQLRNSFSTNGMPAKPHIFGGASILFWPKLTLRFQKFEPVKTVGKWYEQQVDNFQITVSSDKNNTSIGVPESRVYYTVNNTTTDDHVRGVSEVECLIKAGIMLGIVKKGGAWYQYKDVKGQGEIKFGKLLVESGLLVELEEEVLALSWEKASKGRMVVDHFYIDKDTGKLLTGAETEGLNVEDAGIIMEPIDLSDEESEESKEANANENTADIYDIV